MYHLIHSDVSPHFLNPETYKCVVFSNSFETNRTLYFLGSDSFYSQQEVFIIMTLGKTSYETIKE